MQYGTSRSWLLSLLIGAAALTACGSGAEPPTAPTPTPAPSAASDAPKTPAARSIIDPTRLVTLESDEYRATLTAQNAALVHFALKDERYRYGDKPIDLVSTDKLTYLPMRLDVQGIAMPEAGWQVEQQGPRAVRFTLDAGDVTLVRDVEVGSGPYQLWSTLLVRNKSDAEKNVQVRLEGYHYVRREDEAGGFLAGRSALAASGMCTADDSPSRWDRADVVEDRPAIDGKVAFGALDNLYFTQALAADGATFERCALSGSDRGGSEDKPDGSLLSLAVTYPKTKLAPRGEAVFRTLAYFGPKTPKELETAGHGLSRASYVGGLPGVDKIAGGLVGLLAWIHDHVVANWGLAIILLTIFVKLVLYPLTAKSFGSIAAMRRLKPAIDEINEKYADDREKKGAAMMELYRKHKINPFGGCLPQLLQLPIWWALYTSLSTNVELFKRPFIGHWQDLAAPDPYYALPLALGILMWVQQKITPSTMDPAQAKMMLYVMPAMITSFMLFLP
ncbi:MAG: YidC/Oxa1 family insertase periplasmic-domain containing protein, partial [Polyangiales bacterium]